MRPRRELTVVVLACALGAAVLLLVARSVWEVDLIARPDPLPPERTERTGADLRPWLPALGWVALAGAGALVATRGVLRRVVGGLLVLAGTGAALTGVPTGVWPGLAAAGGVAVAAAGVLAAVRSPHWPTMGARYDRRTRPAPAGGPGEPEPGDPAEPGDPEEFWRALDRGEDPTAR